MKKQKKHGPLIIPSIFLGISILIAAFSIIISSHRTFSQLENTFLWTFSLCFSFASSYLFAIKSKQESSLAPIHSLAKSAVRRIFQLTTSLSRLMELTEQSKKSSQMSNEQILEQIQYVVAEHFYTAASSIEDWRDIIPEYVEALEKQAARK
jgi:hypothetical protein